MSATIPNILLVFVNPGNDLDAVKIESNNLENLLRFVKNTEKTIDYDPQRERSLMEVIETTAAIDGYKADIFHFSGHANEKALLFPDGKKPGLAICTFLKYCQAKIIFLNGCSTKGLIKEIFETTSVKAAIATYCKVRDDDAAALSVNFYKNFIRGKNNLKKSFDLTSAGFQVKPLHNSGFRMRDVEDMDDDQFPNADSDCFQWGLFYRDPLILSATIGSLESAQKEAIDGELQEARSLLAEQEKFLEDLKEGSSSYLKQQEIINKQNEIISSLEKDYYNIEEAEQKAIEDQQKILLKEQFTQALKQINYYPQREIYNTGNRSTFGAFAAIGDSESLVQLLQVIFTEEYGLTNAVPYTLDSTSAAASAFWPELAKYLHLQDVALKLTEEALKPRELIQYLKDAVVKKLIDDIFFVGKSVSQQNILIELKINKVTEEKILETTREFWSALGQYCQEHPVFKLKPAQIKHKIIMLLTDDEANSSREESLKNKIDGVAIDPAVTIKVMPLIQPLTQLNIFDWIRILQLDRVGLQPKMAGDIFLNSNKGHIKRIMEIVKARATIKELDLFTKLNIIANDPSTLHN